MMKMKLIILFLSSALLFACSEEDFEQPLLPAETLQLNVSIGDFVTDGALDTRATDNGSVTTFGDGERIGIIAVDASGNILRKNTPYKYTSSSNTWTLDESTGGDYYYDSKATYIAYYPYSDGDAANAATSVADLKVIFSPKENQSQKEDYRASDLMVWISQTPSSKNLNVILTHAYASVSLYRTAKYTLDSNSGITEPVTIVSELSNVAIVVDGKNYTPYKAEDNSYRYILPATLTNGGVGCYYTSGGSTYYGALTVGQTPTPNTRYTYTEAIDDGTYTLDKAQKGDFYCMTAGGEGFLIPKELSDLITNTDNNITCIGIVFKAGVGAEDDIKNYKSDESGESGKNNGINGLSAIHGYAVALKDASTSKGSWGPRQPYTALPMSYFLGLLPQYNGYAITKIVRSWNYTDSSVSGSGTKDFWSFKTASDYNPTGNADTPAAPTASSGWYLPSIQQLIDFAEYTELETLLTAVGGTQLKDTKDDSAYWSATQYMSADAWYYQIKGTYSFDTNTSNKDIYGDVQGASNAGKSDNGDDWKKTCYVRAILTF
ncbi:fimbrillin family protein [Bacteroides sp.]|uniref:fimbrillin family protein n=1 Tax=Bacteroides sp. TaxID=29523 RepID=UPI003AB63765